MGNAASVYMLARKQADKRRRQSVRYALLSFLLTLVLLVTTGCSAFLFGENKEAYEILKEARENFKYPSSVQIVAGDMSGSYLYCTIRAKNGFGNYRSDTYCIWPSGYVTESTNSMCYRSNALDYDAINQALSGRNTNTYTTFAYYGGYDTMELFILLLILVIALCLNGLLASKASDVAEDKGYEKRTWFHMCFWLGPIPYVIVAAMPDKTLRKRTDDMIQLQKQMLDVLKSGAAVNSGSSNTSYFELPEL